MTLKKVLYIEDNEAKLQPVEMILAKSDELIMLQVITGNSGVDIVKIETPNVIMLYIPLPDINGREVLQILKNNLRNISYSCCSLK